MHNRLIHAQPLHDQDLDLFLDGQFPLVLLLLPFRLLSTTSCLLRHLLLKQTSLHQPPQHPTPTRQPEQHQIHLSPREQLDRDVQEPRVPRAQGQCLVGEAVLGDVLQRRGEDGHLGGGVVVGRERGVVLRVVWSGGLAG